MRELEFRSVDEALAVVGGYKRWHILMFVLLSFSAYCNIAWHGLSIIFIGWTPPYHCSDFQANDTSNATLVGQCTKSDQPGSDPCGNWTYVANGYTSIVTQWDLVCSKKLLAELPQCILMIGCLLADIFGLRLLDRFGRKKVHILSNVAIAVVGAAVGWLPNYVAFICLRAVEGFLLAMSGVSGLVFQLELFDSKRREFPGMGSNLGWISCYFFLCVMGYLLKDWRVFQTVLSAFSLVWIIYIWITPESPLWLEANTNHSEAEKALLEIGQLNGLKLKKVKLLTADEMEAAEMTTCDKSNPDVVNSQNGGTVNSEGNSEINSSQVIHEESVEKPTDNMDDVVQVKKAESHISQLFADPILRKQSIISSLLWLTNTLVYYFLALSSPSLAGERFQNLFIGGLIEIPAYVLGYFLVKIIGRRMTLMFDLFLSGIPLLIVLCLPRREDFSMVVTGLSLFSRCLISMSFAVMIPYTKEIVPTNLRGTSTGLFNILGRVANIVVPFGAFMMRTPYRWIPLLVCGLMSIIMGFLLLLMPETTDKPLPQTTEDVYALYDDSQYTGLLRYAKCNMCKRKGRIDATPVKC